MIVNIVTINNGVYRLPHLNFFHPPTKLPIPLPSKMAIIIITKERVGCPNRSEYLWINGISISIKARPKPIKYKDDFLSFFFLANGI